MGCKSQFGDVSVSWDAKEQNIRLTIRQVDDVHFKGQYNYELNLSIEELLKILDCLPEQGMSKSGNSRAEKLAPATRSLLRLLIAAGGFPQIEQVGLLPILRSTA